MFGYIRVFPQQLKLCEIEDYKRVYCGLCRQIGQYTQLGRLMLSFDMVFFTILAMYEQTEAVSLCKSRSCFRQVNCPSVAMDYWACASVILIRKKLENDLRDGNRRARYYLPYFTHAYRKTVSLYPEIDTRISQTLEDIAFMETQKTEDPTPMVAAFGAMMRDILIATPGFCDIRAPLGEFLANITALISEWLYYIDFYDDLEKDIAEKQYNPLAIRMSRECIAADVAREGFKHEIDTRVAELQRLCAFLPYDGFSNIIRNVLHEGVVSVTADVYERRFIPSKRGVKHSAPNK